MDKYNAKIARELLSDARAKIIAMQDYLIQGNAPDSYIAQSLKITRDIDKLQYRVMLITEPEP